MIIYNSAMQLVNIYALLTQSVRIVVMYGNTYSRRRRARDVRRAAERVQRVEGAAQESQELSRG